MPTNHPPGLLRLVYASRSSLPPAETTTGIHPEIARILMQSRRNNPRKGLVGALYCSDGFFFQCLEGAASEVEALYQRLHGDPRHRDMKVLARQSVDALSFAGWTMKYVPNATEVRAVLARHGRQNFDPYAFDPATIDAMVKLLLNGPDVVLPEKSAGAPPPWTLDTVASRTRWALGIGSAALVTALLALLLPLVR